MLKFPDLYLEDQTPPQTEAFVNQHSTTNTGTAGRPKLKAHRQGKSHSVRFTHYFQPLHFLIRTFFHSAKPTPATTFE